MNTYPAVRDPGSIELLFKSIRTKEIPEKITTDYLSSIGFRRQSDVKLLELLFFLGFMDSSLAPSALWKSAAGSENGAFASLLGEALSRSYSSVFQICPDGRIIDGKSLMTFFRQETGVSDTEAAYMVLTLQVLTDIADLNGAAPSPGEGKEPAVPAPEKEPVTEPTRSVPDVPDEPAPTIQIPREGVSLNITIPPEAMDMEMTELVKELLRKLR